VDEFKRFDPMAIKQHLTAEELWALPETPGVRYELVKGEVIEVPGASVLHSLIAALIYNLIRDTVRAGKLGFAFPDGVGYLIRRHPDTLRIPDASFISWASIPERKVPEGFWPVAPDLAVEVVSPFDRADDVHNKVHEYLEAGTQLVWVLWPRRQSVTIYDGDGLMRELAPEHYLDGGTILPGFSVQVAELFAVESEWL
jgi:Uma2 family endonuclease